MSSSSFAARKPATVERTIGGKRLTLESGRLAKQAIGAMRLARVDGQLIALPNVDELAESDLDLVVASTNKAIVMIEGFGDEVPEPEMLEAIMTAHRLNQEVIAMQHDLVAALGLPPF